MSRFFALIMILAVSGLWAGEKEEREQPKRPRLAERERDEEREEEEGPMEVLLNKRVSLKYDNVPLKQVLINLHKTGINIVMHQRSLREMADEPITLALTEVPMRVAIEMLARSLDLRMSWGEGVLYLGPKGSADGQVTLSKRVAGGEIKVTFSGDEIPAHFKPELMEKMIDDMERADDRENDRLNAWRERMERWHKKRKAGKEDDREVKERGNRDHHKPKERNEMF